MKILSRTSSGSGISSIPSMHPVFVCPLWSHFLQCLKDSNLSRGIDNKSVRKEEISICFNIHTVILLDWTLKNGVTLILPSRIARNSSAPDAKRIFEILWGIIEGRTKGGIMSEDNGEFLPLPKNISKNYLKLSYPEHGNDKVLVKFDRLHVKKN